MRRADRPGPSITVPWFLRLLSCVVGLALIAIAVAAPLGAGGISGGQGSSGGSRVLAAGGALVLAASGVWCLLWMRLRLTITDEELIIQNRVRRWRIARDDIIKISATDAAIYVEYLDGGQVRKVDSDVAEGYLQMSLFNRKGRPQHVADNLNDWLLSGQASDYT